jgi:hypothetical protein
MCPFLYFIFSQLSNMYCSPTRIFRFFLNLVLISAKFYYIITYVDAPLDNKTNEYAGVLELADETDSKSVVRKGVWVRIPPPAPTEKARMSTKIRYSCGFCRVSCIQLFLGSMSIVGVTQNGNTGWSGAKLLHFSLKHGTCEECDYESG